MKDWIKQNILGVLILVGIVALIVIILFQKPQNNDAYYQLLLKQSRDSAKLYQPTIDSLTKIVNTKDNNDYAHSDSLSNAAIDATNKVLYELKKQKESVNADTLTSNDLIRYFAGLR